MPRQPLTAGRSALGSSRQRRISARDLDPDSFAIYTATAKADGGDNFHAFADCAKGLRLSEGTIPDVPTSNVPANRLDILRGLAN